MDNNAKLITIKWAHTIVWAFFVFVILYIVYCGFTNNINNWTWIGIGLIIGEGLVLLIFKRQCPLTVLARNYTDAQEENFDIYLPRWLAKYNQEIFTSIFLIGLIMVLYRVL